MLLAMMGGPAMAAPGGEPARGAPAVCEMAPCAVPPGPAGGPALTGLPAGPPVPAGRPDRNGVAPQSVDAEDEGAAPEPSPAKARPVRKSGDETAAVEAIPAHAAPAVMPVAIEAPPALPLRDAPAADPVSSAPPRAIGPGPDEAARPVVRTDTPVADPPVMPPPGAGPRAPRARDDRSGGRADPGVVSAPAPAVPGILLAPDAPERGLAEKPQLLPTIVPSPPHNPAPSAGAARPSQAAAPEMIVAMSLHSASAGPGASQRITLNLTPIELGRVSFDIDVPAHGPRRVAVVFERADTMALFQQDQGHLALALDRAGLPTDAGQITFSLAPPPSHAPDPAPSDPFAGTAGSTDPGGSQPGRGEARPRPDGSLPADPAPEAATLVAAYRFGPRTSLDIIA